MQPAVFPAAVPCCNLEMLSRSARGSIAVMPDSPRDTPPVRIPSRLRKRNVIGAPIPARVLAPIYARLDERLFRLERAIRVLRIALAVVVLGILAQGFATTSLSLILVASYAALGLGTLRSDSAILTRALVVGDVIFVPLLLLPNVAESATLPFLITAIGSWITLNALTGNTRRTRDRVTAYLALLVLCIFAVGATVLDAVIVLLFCVISTKVARVQKHRLIGHTIRSAERLQRALAMSPTSAEDMPATS